MENNSTKFKAGFVALIGRPNVGKSSLVNALIGEKVAAVSPKPQTTRNAIRCIFTSKKRQIIFVDTPGIHKPQHALGEYMIQEASDVLSQVDAICYLVEAGDRSVGDKDKMILETLTEQRLPVILIINKVDTLSDKDQYKKAEALYRKYISPVAVVAISALKKINLELLAETVGEYLPEQPCIYPEDMIMDSTERFLAAEIIREKIFCNTDEEVPHGVAVVIDEFKTPDEFPELKTAVIRATVVVDRPGQKGIIIGKAGSMLKKIGSEARKDLEEKFGYPIFLQIWVKVKPGWKKSEEELRRLGYSF